MRSAKEIDVDLKDCDIFQSGYPIAKERTVLTGAVLQQPFGLCDDEPSSVPFARLSPGKAGRYEIVFGGSSMIDLLERPNPTSTRISLMLADFTDEEAFRLAERTNRERKDLPPLAHSRIISAAFRKYYSSNVEDMSERLAVDKRMLRMSIDFGCLDPEILAAFGDLSELTPQIVAPVIARLRNAHRRNAIVLRASVIAAETSEQIRTGVTVRPAKDIVEDLCSQNPISIRRSHVTELRSMSGALIAKLFIHRKNEGSIIVINPPCVSAEERQAILLRAIDLLQS